MNEVGELRARLAEAEDILRAIRLGEVDAVVVEGPGGDQLFTLKSADEPYRILIEEMNQGAVTLSADGAILFCNRRFAALLSWRLEEIIGFGFELFVEPAERPRFQSMLAMGSLLGSAGEITLRASDGSAVPVQLSLSRLPEESAAAICLVATDISESKLLESELKSREARLSEAQGLARIGSWEVDMRTTTVRWSDALYQIYGLSRSEFLPGRESYVSHIHPEDRPWVVERVERAQAEKGSFTHDHRIVRTDGTFGVIQARGRMVLDEAGEALKFVGTSQDITERKQVEAALEEANRQLREASRRAGMAEVATSVLHNVGNVLNSVNISATFASEKIRRNDGSDLLRVAALFCEHRDDLPAFLSGPQGSQLPAFLTRMAEHFAVEQRAVLLELQSLGAHIDHIKEIVAMQQSYARIACVTEELSVELLVEDALRLNAAALERHGVLVVRNYECALKVEVDKHKVLQILVNLIRNAKYAMEESAAMHKQLTLRIHCEEAQSVCISIRDEGVGIPAENLTRIFEHGFTTRDNGHGFGLHSAALAAREIGGSLKVQSDGPGCGALFTLQLPISPIRSQS